MGKVALVTGASSGIGLATVEKLAKLGFAVAINHLPDDPRGPEAVDRLRDEGFSVVSAPGDVSQADDVDRMVTEAVARLGRLDVLVNNAGTPGTTDTIPLGDFDRMTEEFWTTLLSTNLIGPFRCTRAAAPALREARGAVVNTASVGGMNVVGSSLAYGASKAALINMTQNLARALAPDVRVNAVAPGFVETGWTSTWSAERVAGLVERTPLKRACTPGDIADAMVFLCVGTTMMTGQTIVVDGGLSL